MTIHKNPKDVNDSLLENNPNLLKLGFDEWFKSQSGEFLQNDFSLARVIEVNKNSFKISDGRYEINAELSGKFLFNTEESTDYPTVGDWVVVQCFDNYTMAIIHHILPRCSLLKRKDPGKAVAFQLIAANINYAFIVQSVDSNFNLNRLERYLVMIHESNIQPLIVLNKTDLITETELEEILEKIGRLNDKYPVYPISSLNEDGIQPVRQALQTGKTYCLMGSSGVGKTTLLNALLGEQAYNVGDVRASDHKGKHTTTKRQLAVLDSGGIIIDTPGMRELGNFGIQSGLDEAFDDIAEFGKKCRFVDCTHSHEKGCAVKGAVEQGLLEQERYDNYLHIQKESAYYDMSYLEKRQKDKSFGKMLKNYKKEIRKK